MEAQPKSFKSSGQTVLSTPEKPTEKEVIQSHVSGPEETPDSPDSVEARGTPNSVVFSGDVTEEYESADENFAVGEESFGFTRLSEALEKVHLSTPKPRELKPFIFPYETLEVSGTEELSLSDKENDETNAPRANSVKPDETKPSDDSRLFKVSYEENVTNTFQAEPTILLEKEDSGCEELQLVQSPNNFSLTKTTACKESVLIQSVGVTLDTAEPQSIQPSEPTNNPAELSKVSSCGDHSLNTTPVPAKTALSEETVLIHPSETTGPVELPEVTLCKSSKPAPNPVELTKVSSCEESGLIRSPETTPDLVLAQNTPCKDFVSVKSPATSPNPVELTKVSSCEDHSLNTAPDLAKTSSSKETALVHTSGTTASVDLPQVVIEQSSQSAPNPVELEKSFNCEESGLIRLPNTTSDSLLTKTAPSEFVSNPVERKILLNSEEPGLTQPPNSIPDLVLPNTVLCEDSVLLETTDTIGPHTVLPEESSGSVAIGIVSESIPSSDPTPDLVLGEDSVLFKSLECAPNPTELTRVALETYSIQSTEPASNCPELTKASNCEASGLIKLPNSTPDLVLGRGATCEDSLLAQSSGTATDSVLAQVAHEQSSVSAVNSVELTDVPSCEESRLIPSPNAAPDLISAKTRKECVLAQSSESTIPVELTDIPSSEELIQSPNKTPNLVQAKTVPCIESVEGGPTPDSSEVVNGPLLTQSLEPSLNPVEPTQTKSELNRTHPFHNDTSPNPSNDVQLIPSDFKQVVNAAISQKSPTSQMNMSSEPNYRRIEDEPMLGPASIEPKENSNHIDKSHSSLSELYMTCSRQEKQLLGDEDIREVTNSLDDSNFQPSFYDECQLVISLLNNDEDGTGDSQQESMLPAFNADVNNISEAGPVTAEVPHKIEVPNIDFGVLAQFGGPRKKNCRSSLLQNFDPLNSPLPPRKSVKMDVVAENFSPESNNQSKSQVTTPNNRDEEAATQPEPLICVETPKKNSNSDKSDSKELIKLREENARLLTANKQLSFVMSEYEKTISKLIVMKDEAVTKSQNEAAERDSAYLHLKNMEIAFNDIHEKYEKAKKMIEALYRNEQKLKGSTQEAIDNLEKVKEMCRTLKRHATEKLDAANKEINELHQTHQVELAKWKAVARKSEMHTKSMQDAVDLKNKEIRELTEICDELLTSVKPPPS